MPGGYPVRYPPGYDSGMSTAGQGPDTPAIADAPIRTGSSLEDRLAALPRVDAFGMDTPTGLAALFTAWSRRHTLVTLAAIPLFYLLYGNAVGALLPANALVQVSLALAAVLAALVAATYLPTGRTNSGPTPCGAGAIFPVLLALFLFQGSLETPASAVMATVLVGAGLAQRVVGAGACSA